MPSPYISVIVTAYNRRQYIRQALDSVRAQTLDRSEYEVIVVSNFEGRYEGLNNLRWVTVKETGLAPKIAIGAEEARGEVIALLEDDDVWLPDKLRFVRDSFKSDERLGFLRNAIVHVDQSLRPIPTPRDQYRCNRELVIGPGDDSDGKTLKALTLLLTYIFKYPCFWNLSSYSLRRGLVADLRGALIKRGPGAHGIDLVLALAPLLEGYSVFFSRRALTLYRAKPRVPPRDFLNLLRGKLGLSSMELEWAYSFSLLLSELGPKALTKHKSWELLESLLYNLYAGRIERLVEVSVLVGDKVKAKAFWNAYLAERVKGLRALWWMSSYGPLSYIEWAAKLVGILAFPGLFGRVYSSLLSLRLKGTSTLENAIGA